MAIHCHSFSVTSTLCIVGRAILPADQLSSWSGRLKRRLHPRDHRPWIVLIDNQGMAHAITRDPETMHGVPVFRNTRVPVQTLFDYLEGGDTLEDFLNGFPAVPRALAVEALEEARLLLLAHC